MKKLLPKIDTAQLAMLLTLAGSVATMTETYFKAVGNETSAIYIFLTEGSGADWVGSNFIHAFQNDATGCGIREFNASTVLNITKASFFYTKKFLGDRVSLGVSGLPVDEQIQKCMQHITHQLVHAIKVDNSPIPMTPLEAAATYFMCAILAIAAIVGVTAAVCANKDKILNAVKPMTDALGLTSSEQADPEAQLINADKTRPSYV